MEYTVPREFNPVLDTLRDEWAKHVLKYLEEEYNNRVQQASDNQDVIAEICLYGGEKITVAKFGSKWTNIITVDGFLNGNPVSLWLHQCSLQVLFSTLPKERLKNRPKIGFVTEAESASPVQQG